MVSLQRAFDVLGNSVAMTVHKISLQIFQQTH